MSTTPPISLKRAPEESSAFIRPPAPQTVQEKAHQILQDLGHYFDSHPAVQWRLGEIAADLGERGIWHEQAQGQGYMQASAQIDLQGIRAFEIPDKEEAITACRPGALQDDAPCQVKLALLLLQGTSLEQKDAIGWLISAALKGNTEAQYQLGNLFNRGLGVDQDAAKARILFEVAAQQGHAHAQFKLGECYERGQGVKRDPQLALEWYQKAAAQNLPRALNLIGVLYGEGRLVNRDLTQRDEYYQRAAQLGDGMALRNLGFNIQKSDPTSANSYFTQAIAALRKGVEAQDPRDLRGLGYCYQYGNGIEIDLAQATELYRQAAEMGDERAFYDLANCYWNGTGVVKDKNTAFQWYQRAANRGLAQAERELGECYEYGIGVEKDEERAFHWYKCAADHGLAQGQRAVGWCYAEGFGTAKDKAQAFAWFQRAADQGDAMAECDVGECYEKAIGVEQNLDEACRWYERSAEHGFSEGQLGLGELYQMKGWHEEAFAWFVTAAELGGSIKAACRVAACYEWGRGVPKDLQQAEKWYLFAAHKEDADAQYLLSCKYRRGCRIPANLSEARKWLIKAAQNGSINAQLELAKYYRLGWTDEEQLILAQDLRQAFYWSTQAANQGDTEAKYWLANAYHRGRGVSRDPQLAMHYYLSCLDLNESFLSSDEIDAQQKIQLAKEIEALSLTAKMDISEAPEWQTLLNEIYQLLEAGEDPGEFPIDINRIGNIFFELEDE